MPGNDFFIMEGSCQVGEGTIISIDADFPLYEF